MANPKVSGKQKQVMCVGSRERDHHSAGGVKRGRQGRRFYCTANTVEIKDLMATDKNSIWEPSMQVCMCICVCVCNHASAALRQRARPV